MATARAAQNSAFGADSSRGEVIQSLRARSIGQPVFVLAARIAAHLDEATKLAEILSLTAKNARAITSRAGQKAVGFRAITDFIEELASNTIKQGRVINDIAMEISMQASALELAEQALAHFKSVQRIAHDAPYVDSLLPAITITAEQVSERQYKFKRQLWLLQDRMEEAERQIRSSSIISSTSKVEASLAGEFQQSLEVIASNIDSAANDIRLQLSQASELLSAANIN